MTGAMSSVQDVLGIDLDELQWIDLALCDGTMDTNMFFDDYEADEQVAKVVDEACLSCPVMAQCLQRGMDNNEWGVWGGIYLVAGKADKNRNSHKTEEVKQAMREKISGDESLL